MQQATVADAQLGQGQRESGGTLISSAWKASSASWSMRPHQESAEHHARCPICGHPVDELDLAEVMEHLEPDHQAPKN